VLKVDNRVTVSHEVGALLDLVASCKTNRWAVKAW
jgi:hypothetical protein